MGKEEGVVSTNSISESPLDGVLPTFEELTRDSSDVETLVRTKFGEQLVNSIESLRRELAEDLVDEGVEDVEGVNGCRFSMAAAAEEEEMDRLFGEEDEAVLDAPLVLSKFLLGNKTRPGEDEAVTPDGER